MTRRRVIFINNMTRVHMIRRIQRGRDTFPRDWTHELVLLRTTGIHMMHSYVI